MTRARCSCGYLLPRRSYDNPPGLVHLLARRPELVDALPVMTAVIVQSYKEGA